MNVAISSVFMALLAYLFLIAGKLSLVPKGKVVRFGIFFSAGISLCSMLAGSEYVLRSMTGVPLLGLVMAIVGGTIVVLGIEKIKAVNALMVPLIVMSVAIIFFKLDPQPYSLPFSMFKPLLYSGLDVLLGGVILSEEGAKLSYKEIFLSCAIICLSLFGLLFMLQTVVLADGLTSSMPVLGVAERFGLKWLCGILIATAIFTTLVSSLKLVSDRVRLTLAETKRLSALGGDGMRAFVVFFCLLIAYPISFVGFDAIVDSMYPVISWCGVALTALIALKLLAYCALKLKRQLGERRNRRLKYKST